MASSDAAAEGLAGLVERVLAPEHAESLVALSAEAGWNQVAADWRFMLEAGRGVGMADAAGTWVASALTLPLGPKLAWISMVLTTKAWRGRGIGTRLLRRCVDNVRAAGAVPGLDATELGRPIYLPLGFGDVFTLKRWHLGGTPAAVPSVPGLTIRRMGAKDIPVVTVFDVARTGMERGAILEHLQARAPYLAFIAERDDAVVGYVLGREGRIAHHIGPIVAESEAIALALAAQAANAASPPFIIDLLDRHAAIRGWLETSGATAPRGFTRMTIGAVPGLDRTERLFALAGPELA
jgi:GNAT superfamily N-acetyltransferase